MNTFRRLTLFVTRYRGLAVIFGFAALLVLSLLLARSNVTGAAHAASGATSGNAKTFTGSADICNNADPTKWKIDNLVGASWTVSNNTATYTFSSFVNENPSGGVPGLIEYCVYTTPSPNTGSVTASYDSWEPLEGTDKFSFIRPNGDPTNIPFDGSTQTVGKATWSAGVPTSQTILLHINDPAVCNKLYGGNPGTCFVLPGSPPQQAKDLTVSKTATPSFTRTYKWGIQKSVDKTEIDIADGTNGNSATFHYTVSVSHDSGTDSNWQVTGTITVNNPNGFDVSGVNVTDAIDNNGSCSVTGGTNVTVPAGKSVTLSYTCTYTSAPSASKGINTATATWDGTKYNTPDSSASGSADFDFGSVSPKLVDKCVTVTDTLGGTFGPVCVGDPGEVNNTFTFTYSYKVTGKAGTCVSQNNTATFTTNDTSTSDSASKTVKVCVGVDLTVSKTASPSFTRTYNWSIAKSVDNSQINIASGSSATFNYKVTVTETGFTDSGWQVTGQITVTNPNDWEAITANVSDAVDNIVNNGGSCTVSGGMGVSVPKSGSVTLNYTCTYTSAPGSSSGTNTATATWDSNAFFTPDNSASGSVGFAFTTPTTTVNQTINVTDTIGGFLGTLIATDPPAPFTSQTFTYSHTVTNSPPGTCTTYPNTATIFETGQTASQSVKVCVGVDLTVSKTATPSFTRTYKWGIQKKVDQTEIDIAKGGSATFNYTVNVSETDFTDSDWQVTGNITVTNPNDWEAITANVSDAVDNDPNASCVVTGGTNLTLAASGNPGDTVTVPYTCTYSAAPASNSETNRATVSWDKNAASTPNSSAQGTANFDFTTPTKTVNKTITITDTFNGVTTTLGTLKATDAQPFASATYTYSHTESGNAGTCTSYDNTAKIVETGQSSSQTVKVCVGADLTVSKTATPSFTRTYNWSIAKSVDKTLLDPGGTTTYTVTVTETGFQDSDWQVTGNITVTNPNDWEAITANVSDAVDNDPNASCVVTGGTNLTLAASGNPGDTVTVPYTCTYSAAPASNSETNRATVSWDKNAASTPNSSAQGSKTFAFTTPTMTVNKTITVTDTYVGTLGTVTATDSTPFTPQNFTYSRKFAPPASGCQAVNNTATIVQTGQSASASVKNCNSGALTMGFWQNKNGQGIISAADQTKLGNWLRGYHPFSDAPSTGLATYVYNIIKAASCGGTTCNAMLRAQMLSTALDVYFSDPALGGNKINAPAPIGGVKIDLTKICTDISTCTTFVNVSSAFGGATSLTVSQMLSYQNTADPAADAGAVWYNQVKATQVLAKDAFDAINNQVAFAP